jgi:hypothetical protein
MRAMERVQGDLLDVEHGLGEAICGAQGVSAVRDLIALWTAARQARLALERACLEMPEVVWQARMGRRQAAAPVLREAVGESLGEDAAPAAAVGAAAPVAAAVGAAAPVAAVGDAAA